MVERDSSKMADVILADRLKVDVLVGSILFSVSRGRVSAGINFSNENRRALFIIGLPYPSAFGPRVILKR